MRERDNEARTSVVPPAKAIVLGGLIAIIVAAGLVALA